MRRGERHAYPQSFSRSAFSQSASQPVRLTETSQPSSPAENRPFYLLVGLRPSCFLCRIAVAARSTELSSETERERTGGAEGIEQFSRRLLSSFHFHCWEARGLHKEWGLIAVHVVKCSRRRKRTKMTWSTGLVFAVFTIKAVGVWPFSSASVVPMQVNQGQVLKKPF